MQACQPGKLPEILANCQLAVINVWKVECQNVSTYLVGNMEERTSWHPSHPVIQLSTVASPGIPATTLYPTCKPREPWRCSYLPPCLLHLPKRLADSVQSEGHNDRD